MGNAIYRGFGGKQRREPLGTIPILLFTSPRVPSLALMRSWTFVLFFSSILFPLAQVPQSTFTNAYLLSFIFFVLTSLVCGFAHKATARFFETQFGFLCGPALAGIGTLFILAAEGTFANQIIYLGVYSIFTGIGSALTLLDFGRFYSIIAPHVCARESITAFFLGSIIPLIFYALPLPLTVVLCSCLPLAGTLMIHRKNVPSEPLAQNMRRPLKKKFLVKFIIGASIFGVAVGFLRDLYSYSGTFSYTTSWSMFLTLASSVVTLLVLLVVLLNRRFDPLFLYRPILILVAAGFLALPLMHFESFLPGMIACIGYFLFELLIWIVLANISYRFNLPSIKVLGLGRGTIAGGGTLLGAFLVQKATAEELYPYLSSYEIVSAIVALLIIVYCIIFSERDIAWLYPKENIKKTIAGSPPSDVFRETNSLTSEKKPIDTGIGQDASFVTMRSRCAMLAEKYGLTKRELEVMVLLAIGRSAPRIQKELCISLGTVNSHRLHIYQKLNVHTFQELIDLIKGAD